MITRMNLFTVLVLSLFGITGNLSGQYNFNVKRTFGEANHKIVFASYSSDGTYIVTAGSDSSIIIWNTDRNTIYRTLSGLDARPNVAVFSVDNAFLMSGGKDNKVSMWDLSTIPPKIIKTFDGHTGPVKSLDVSPDGNYLATGSADGTVRIWNLQNTNLVYELKGHSKEVNAVSYSPNGRTLASGGADGVIVLWGTGNGSKIISKKGHKGWIRDVDFSSDGSFLASCGDDKLIKKWQVPDLQESGTFKGHKDWIQTIDFSPDGKTLISGGRDKLIILWDVSTQKILLQSEKQEQIVNSVDISPVRSDFISSCFGSEALETWVLSGLDDSQWNIEATAFTSTPGTDHRTQKDQPKVNQEQALNRIPPTKSLDQGNSMIELFAPVPVQGRIVHDNKSIELVGRASDPDGINIFLINRTLVELSESGVFQFSLDLNQGENSLDLVAVNNKGKMDKLNLIIECSAEDALIDGKEVPEISKGEYYALLIGINDYQHPDIADLDNPIHDAENLYNVLLSKYTFEEENIVFLRNPTQAELITALDIYSKELTFNDNLLIFYAGHGYWNEKGKVGYWFPADASRNSTVNWFRNSTLRDFIGSIQTRHTLLIADACFSGAIFKSRAAFTDTPTGIEKLYQLPSRKAMTSGIIQEVPDESVFLKYLVKRLEENEERFLTSEFLFSSFKTPVMNNSSTVPQYGVIQNVGDEGGDFIFIKR